MVMALPTWTSVGRLVEKKAVEGRERPCSLGALSFVDSRLCQSIEAAGAEIAALVLDWDPQSQLI
jgi:hypothetical protein